MTEETKSSKECIDRISPKIEYAYDIMGHIVGITCPLLMAILCREIHTDYCAKTIDFLVYTGMGAGTGAIFDGVIQHEKHKFPVEYYADQICQGNYDLSLLGKNMSYTDSTEL